MDDREWLWLDGSCHARANRPIADPYFLMFFLIFLCKFISSERGVPDCLEGCVCSSNGSTCECKSDSRASSSPDVDGGWAWVVVVAAFFQFFVSSGMYYSFSVFFVELLQSFGETRAKTGWVYSTNSAVHMFCGPLGGWVISRWGPRTAVMLGGVFAGLGNIMTAFAPSLDVVFVTHGFINAVGTSLNFSGWIVGLARFWQRGHALAVGVAMSGSGFGVFVLGPLMETLVQEYGWRGAMLICAGMSFNFSVFGATIYKLRRPSLAKGLYREDQRLMIVVEDVGKPEDGYDNTHTETSEESFHSSDISRSETSLKNDPLKETLAMPSLVGAGSVWSLAHYDHDKQHNPRLRGWLSSLRRGNTHTTPKYQQGGADESGMARRLLCSPTFWLLEASCFLSFMATTTMFAVFLDWTVWSGLGVAFSGALAGSGAGDLLGRVLAGALMGRGLPPLILFSGIQILLAFTIGCAAISSTPGQLVASMVGMGVACGLQSVLYALMPSQLSSGVGVGRVLGYLLFVTGAGALLGPPIAGVIVDQTGSYAPVLMLCATAPAAAAVLNFAAHCTSRTAKSPLKSPPPQPYDTI
ncbi:monocarboxylate transporter 13-like [Homarus americanus]|nr:monocarboxylate transporter 13-like [Homarus americanus]